MRKWEHWSNIIWLCFGRISSSLRSEKEQGWTSWRTDCKLARPWDINEGRTWGCGGNGQRLFMSLESKHLLGGRLWDMTKGGITNDAEVLHCPDPSSGLKDSRHRAALTEQPSSDHLRPKSKACPLLRAACVWNAWPRWNELQFFKVSPWMPLYPLPRWRYAPSPLPITMDHGSCEARPLLRLHYTITCSSSLCLALKDAASKTVP